MYKIELKHTKMTKQLSKLRSMIFRAQMIHHVNLNPAIILKEPVARFAVIVWSFRIKHPLLIIDKITS